MDGRGDALEKGTNDGVGEVADGVNDSHVGVAGAQCHLSERARSHDASYETSCKLIM